VHFVARIALDLAKDHTVTDAIPHEKSVEPEANLERVLKIITRRNQIRDVL
jgi:hypothetical protein